MAYRTVTARTLLLGGVALLALPAAAYAQDAEQVAAEENAALEQAQPGVDVDRVFISKITVDDGPRLRRGRPASKWVRMHRILKRMCHVTVELTVRGA